MDEKGEKYLQSSSYNKYTANRGSKQNTVVRETRREKEEKVFFIYIFQKNKDRDKARKSKQEKVTKGEGGGKINKQVCLVSKTTV